MRSVNDALFELAKTFNKNRDHKISILEIYPLWLKLCPGNRPVLKWLADNTLQYTNDPQLQIHYIDEFCGLPGVTRQEILKYKLKRTVLCIQYCVYQSIEDYDTLLEIFNSLCQDFLAIDAREFPISYYFVPMLARADLACQVMYQIRPMVKANPMQLVSKSRKIGFLWLPIKSDPSFQCLKLFLEALSFEENITIFFDEKDASSVLCLDDKRLLEQITVKSCAGLDDKQIATMIRRENIGVLINMYWNFHRGYGVFQEITSLVVINFQGFASPICAPEVFTYSISDVFLRNKITVDVSNREKLIIMPIYHQINFPDVDQPDKVISIRDPFILGYIVRATKLAPHHVKVISEFLDATHKTRIHLFCTDKNLKLVSESLMMLELLPKHLNRIDVIYEPRRQEYLRRIRQASMFLDTFGHWSMHSTALEVIWNWIPFLTVKSDTLFSHSEAILQSLDLDELAFSHPRQVVEALIEFSRPDSTRYTAVCHKLISNCEKTGLFNMAVRVRLFKNLVSSVLKDETSDDILMQSLAHAN